MTGMREGSGSGVSTAAIGGRYHDSPIRMRVGDAVTWRYETRGGWGYVFHIPAYIVKLDAKRIGIAALKLNDEWVARWVKPESLTYGHPSIVTSGIAQVAE